MLRGAHLNLSVQVSQDFELLQTKQQWLCRYECVLACQKCLIGVWQSQANISDDVEKILNNDPEKTVFNHEDYSAGLDEDQWEALADALAHNTTVTELLLDNASVETGVGVQLAKALEVCPDSFFFSLGLLALSSDEQTFDSRGSEIQQTRHWGF